MGVLGRFALLKTYCVIPIDGVLHNMYSSDLLALWGEAMFEASLHVYAASGPTYQDTREREFAAVLTLIQNECHGSSLVRLYMVEWGLARWRGFEFVVRERVYRHEIRITDIQASVANYLRGNGPPQVDVCFSWDRQSEPIWLSSDDAADYFEDWLDDMLVEFLEATDFSDETAIAVPEICDIVPSFNVPL